MPMESVWPVQRLSSSVMYVFPKSSILLLELGSGADDRLYSIRPMELLSFSVRRVVRSGTITSFQGPVLS